MYGNTLLHPVFDDINLGAEMMVVVIAGSIQGFVI
jgi:hypothetical protein